MEHFCFTVYQTLCVQKIIPDEMTFLDRESVVVTIGEVQLKFQRT